METEGENLLLMELEKNLEAGDIVLEVGAGNCSFLSKVVDKFQVEGYGVDPYIWGNSSGIKCFRIRGEELSELELKFNLIYLIRSFHHLNDPSRFIEEAKKVLLPGGKLVIVDWKKGTKTGISENYYSESEVVNLLEEKEFKVIASKSGNYNLVVVGEV